MFGATTHAVGVVAQLCLTMCLTGLYLGCGASGDLHFQTQIAGGDDPGSCNEPVGQLWLRLRHRPATVPKAGACVIRLHSNCGAVPSSQQFCDTTPHTASSFVLLPLHMYLAFPNNPSNVY